MYNKIREHVSEKRIEGHIVMNRNEKTTKALKEELQKLTTAVSFNTWLQPLEVFQIDSDLKIAYLGVKRSGGIDVDFL